MIGEQKKAGIIDTAKKIAILQSKLKMLETTLQEELNIENCDSDKLEDFKNVLCQEGYNGISLFYIFRRQRELQDRA